MTDIFDIDPVRGFAKGIPDSFGPLFGKDVVNLCDEVDRLRVLVSEMTLHSLGCSGKATLGCTARSSAACLAKSTANASLAWPSKGRAS